MIFHRRYLMRRLTYSTFRCLRLKWPNHKAIRLQSTGQPLVQAQASLKNEDLSKIRNIGIMAHIDAGKTTTTERMLYYSGFSNHLGDVDDGDTIMDYMEQERARGITITSAAITFMWKKFKMNLIDTPGHVDFTVEVERALRVLDGAVAILDASAGVEAQTLTVWRQADHYDIPRIVFLNKMDKMGANLDLCLESLHQRFHVEPLLVNFPIGVEKTFKGVVNLISMEALIWDSQKSPDGRVYDRIPLYEIQDQSLVEKCELARIQLLEQLADLDDRIAEHILSDTNLAEVPAHDIKSALRKVTLQRRAVVVLCGSSLRNKGVQELMDAVVDYLPSPLDVKYDFTDYYRDDLCALAFKIIHDKIRGPLTFLRIYSGTIKSNGTLYNINMGCEEKISRLLQVYANHYKEINEAGAGNIVCLSGFLSTKSGDTLTASYKTAKAAKILWMKKHGSGKAVTSQEENEVAEENEGEVEGWVENTRYSSYVLAGLKIPPPVFFCSVEAPSISSQKMLDLALQCLQREDPSLRVETNPDTGQTILSGMGELHLDVIKNRILKEYKVDAYMGPLQIAYKEAMKNTAQYSETLDRTVGDKHNQVTLTISVSPSKDNIEFKQVELDAPHDKPLVIKWQHLKAINSGVSSALNNGPLLGFPVINVRVKLHEFQFRMGTSLPMMSACAFQCVTKALQESGCILLEPFMSLEIIAEETHVNAILGDLSRRRGQIEQIGTRHGAKLIQAVAPLAEMMGYSTSLRTISSGTATFTMDLSHYEKVSPEEHNKAVERVTGFSPV
ncbi:hypothetical protein CHS0354_021616 [Potamilus streckersoni]|uniref:Tr-type G domain-containing protein n=1 Tax=Potamilus streckersoni TaxID=2493646 RepID=A0AAE0VZ45_9BIVA|nr:hypothetical protein CHS0354_021616 [Potamilus streckersoni]